MIPETLLGLGNKALRLLRVLGRLEFIRRLHDFLVHEGRRSRADVVEQTAKAVLDLEKAESLRLRNAKTLLELMKAAGFPEEKIQTVLSSPEEMQRVSSALTTLLQYVDRGIVTVSVVEQGATKQERKPLNQVKLQEIQVAQEKTYKLSRKNIKKQ